jgi:hypothetical protein
VLLGKRQLEKHLESDAKAPAEPSSPPAATAPPPKYVCERRPRVPCGSPPTSCSCAREHTQTGRACRAEWARE